MAESLRFDRIEVRPRERQLLVDGVPAAMGGRAFDLLLALIERRDRLVGKNELLELVWPGLVVEENNLQVQISSLRKLLGPQAIATVPGRGYRFTAALADAKASAHPADGGAQPALSPSAAAVPGNLPVELPVLYGREADLQALRALIEAHRLVTVVGAGGIGKSRLAQAAARSIAGHWSDGAWIVELAGLSDPDLLPAAVAQVLDVRLGTGAPVEALAKALAPRAALLVLDNCEHLLDAVAALAQAVLNGAVRVTLLVTSQEPLRLAAEQQYRVVPLAVPAAADRHAREAGAVALFEARVRAIDPRFALDEASVPLAVDICRRLDGLPLAIELAAARVATLGLRSVRDKLDARFRLLTGGSRAALPRHQTLHAALEWSFNLLGEGERAVLRRLGVFAGGFTAEMAQAACADAGLDEWSVLDHLSALIDKSLVVANGGSAPRYRLLETTRAFALEQLAGAGETADLLQRHARVMRDHLKRVDDANIDGELRTHAYAALVVPELDNLRAAYEWAMGESGDRTVAVALAAHAGSLIDYAPEWGERLLPLREFVAAGQVEDALAARYWRAIAGGNMGARVSSAEQEQAGRRAAALYEAQGQTRRVFSSLYRVSTALATQGRSDEAKAVLDAARALLRPDWPAEFHIWLLRRDGTLARNDGRFDEALRIHHEAVRASAAHGDWRLEVIARSNLIDLLWQMGPLADAADEARRFVGQLRARPAATGDMDSPFAMLFGILSEQGQIDEAMAVAREALPRMVRTGEFYAEEWAHLFWRRGQLELAARMLGAAAARLERGSVLQVTNETRLAEQVRADLTARLAPQTLAQRLAEGAALGAAELRVVIGEALAQATTPP